MWKIIYSIFSFLTTTLPSYETPHADLLFVGDAMQHQAQLDKALEIGKGEYDYSGCFSLISPEIRKADYAVCNLEVPLGGPDYSGYPCFSSPPSFAESLKDAGFDLFLTANNHCLDRRDKGARMTLEILDSLGVDHTGTFHDAAQRDTLVPLIKDINGFKVAFLNYTYGTNGIRPSDGVEVALIDTLKIKEEIELAKKKKAEIIVANMHWGIEYVLLENNIQRKLAAFLAENGVDLIIGGHPHVVQPMKILKNEKTGKETLVVYSLGNFISNMKTADTRGGAILWVTLTRDSLGNAKFDNPRYQLLFAAKPEGDLNYRVIPGWIEDSVPQSQRNHWEIFKRGAMKVFNKYNEGVELSPADSFHTQF
ncbi:MAG: CapA family protein [Muribaculaceae bacterium]|nr:CapA family protein [Muribaculaceae bacterium]